MKRLILASGSPRRAELLGILGVRFDVVSPDVDETRRPGEEPGRYVERLARAKAEVGAAPETVSLGADTVIVHDGRVLGKPGHPSEARSMLTALAGTTHHVLSGVAVAMVEGGRLVVDSLVESALVRFAAVTEDEIDAYIATGEPLDRAGAYAIQEKGALLVESIDGHPTTVIGLPLPATRRLLTRMGIETLV